MSLLQKAKNRREGMWDGLGALRVAERVSEIEHEAVVVSGLIPDAAQVRDVDVTVFLEDRKLLMRYCLRTSEEKAVTWKQEWISW